MIIFVPILVTSIVSDFFTAHKGNFFGQVRHEKDILHVYNESFLEMFGKTQLQMRHEFFISRMNVNTATKILNKLS